VSVDSAKSEAEAGPFRIETGQGAPARTGEPGVWAAVYPRGSSVILSTYTAFMQPGETVPEAKRRAQCEAINGARFDLDQLWAACGRQGR